MTTRHLLRDESGMTMGLVIVMIVLIGVMGAGLLTFVQRDLETVVEVNKGQKALEMADAGLQEARRQLIADSVRQHYDRKNDNDCGAPRKRKGDDWSPVAESKDCGEGVDGAPGVTRSFGDGRFQVTIECFAQQGDPSPPASDVPCAEAQTGESPEPATQASQRSFFKVVSTGFYPDESGAKRRTEAIVYRESSGLPLAYYTPKDIDFGGTPDVNGVSFFAGGNITGVGGGDVTVGPAPDPLLGNWGTSSPSTSYVPTSNFNTYARGTTAAGFAAAGRVCKGNEVSCNAPPSGTSYFDSTSAAGRPQLVPKADPNAVNANGTISYPFDPAVRPDMELLGEEATKLGTYYTPSNGSFSITNDRMRQALEGGSAPVIFVDFQGAPSNGNNVKIDTEHDATIPAVLVVRNGNVSFEGRDGDVDRDGYTEFRGAIIVEGNGSTTGAYDAGGRSELSGFVFADGDITIGSNAQAEALLAKDDAGNAPPRDFFDRMLSFNRIRLWSWQEVYK